MKQKFAKKKIQGNVFLLNERPHAKIQLIWVTFKKRPKSSLTIVLHKTLQLSDLQSTLTLFGQPGGVYVVIIY